MSHIGRRLETDPYSEAEKLVSTDIATSPFVHPEGPQEDTRLRSIQGELLDKDPKQWRADQADVDAYVDRQSDEVLKCRQRSRHEWPELKRDAVDNFDGVDDDGLFFRRLICEDCRLNVRFEMFEAKSRGGRVWFEYVGAKGPFPIVGPDGETYKAPSGIGTMTGRQVKNSLVTRSMQGVSLKDIRRQVKAKQKNNPDLTPV